MYGGRNRRLSSTRRIIMVNYVKVRLRNIPKSERTSADIIVFVIRTLCTCFRIVEFTLKCSTFRTTYARSLWGLGWGGERRIDGKNKKFALANAQVKNNLLCRIRATCIVIKNSKTSLRRCFPSVPILLVDVHTTPIGRSFVQHTPMDFSNCVSNANRNYNRLRVLTYRIK